MLCFWIWFVLFSNMVCFALIILFWFLFFNSSLLVSHFKMVVFKQQKYQKRARFCFRIWFILSWLLFFNSNLLVSHFKMVSQYRKYQTRACFCFRTWFVLFWLLWFDLCFSIQVCWFLTSRLLLLNKQIWTEHVFVFEHGFFALIIVYWFLFFNSSLLVSHFKMVVFKQQKYQKRTRFCFRIWFVLSWLLFFNSSLLVSHFKMVS